MGADSEPERETGATGRVEEIGTIRGRMGGVMKDEPGIWAYEDCARRWDVSG